MGGFCGRKIKLHAHVKQNQEIQKEDDLTNRILLILQVHILCSNFYYNQNTTPISFYFCCMQSLYDEHVQWKVNIQEQLLLTSQLCTCTFAWFALHKPYFHVYAHVHVCVLHMHTLGNVFITSSLGSFSVIE